MPRTESAFAGPANTGCLPNGRKHWVFTEPSCVCLHTVNTDFCVYAELRTGSAHPLETLDNKTLETLDSPWFLISF